MIAYTAYPDIQGIIYEDELNRKRLMHIDKIYKFSDGTLNYGHTAPNDIDIGIEMDYFITWHTDYPVWEVIQKGNGPDAIKSKFGSNDESKKMQKYILKQQLKGFSISNSKGIHKGYARFQSLLSQLEIHGVGVSSEDANQKVFKSDVKGSTTPSSNTQNVVFLSSESTSGTNDVSIAYSASSTTGLKIQRENSSSYTNEDTLQENADQKEIRIQEGEMQETLGSKLRIVGEDHESKMKPKPCLNSEVTSCSKECVESYSKLKKLYDEQREQIGDASIEIKAYTQALKKKLLAEAVKEKEDLKAKFEQWKSSSKNIGKLLGSQMSANDKFGLGYGDHRFDGNLSYEKEMFQSVFHTTEKDVENRPLNVRTNEMHTVPPPMIYMPIRTDEEVDDSQYTYGKKQTKTSNTSESVTQTSEYASCDSVSIWNDAPIIEEYESDSDDDYVPKSPKRMGLGYGSTRRACFVCGSYNHLIKDCDFHEKRMAKQAEQNKKRLKGTSLREINTARQNFSKKAVPKKVNTVRPNVNTARRNFVSLSPKSTGNDDNPHKALKNKGIVDSGCSRYMTGNKTYLAKYKDYNGGPIAFGEFKLPNENQVLLKIPRQNNMYSFNLENLVPTEGLACLIAKATVD
ncbi:hypothetical protein Tco_0829005 [Tanacetum coccineum]